MKKLYFAAVFAGIALFAAGCGDKSKADKAAGVKPAAEVADESASFADESGDGMGITDESEQSDGDKLVDEYEKFLDDFYANVKKLESGDVSVMQKVQELTPEMSNWTVKIQDAQANGVFDEKHVERMAEIAAKYAQ